MEGKVVSSFRGLSEIVAGGLVKILVGGGFPSQDFARLPRQPKIMVAGQVFVGQEFRRGLVRRRLARAFENGCAFVHLIEHGNINHLRPGLNGGGQQPPIESPL